MPGAGLTSPYTISDPEQRAATAEAVAEQLAESRERHGADSRAYADAISVSLEALVAIGRPEKAAALGREAIGIYRATGERRGGLFMHAMDQLAEALLRLGRTREAVEVLQEKLETAAGPDGRQGFFDYNTVTRLYYLQERLGRYRQAEDLRRAELEAIRSQSDEAFWSNPRAKKYFMRQVEPDLLRGLAILVAKQGRYDEAARLYRQAMAMSQLIFGANSPNMSKIVQAYARFLIAHGEGPWERTVLEGLRATYPQLFPR